MGEAQPGRVPYPPTYTPYQVHPAPVPKPQHSPLRWAVVAFSALCIAVSSWVGIATAVSPTSPATVSFHAADELEAPPDLDAPASRWNGWARRTVDVTVATQAQALLAGDADAFLAVADPAEEQLLDELQRRFETLQQMGVGQWSQAIRGRPEVTGELAWHADVEVTYCFGEPACRPNTMVIGTDWRLVEGRLVMTGMAPSTRRYGGPRPWEGGDIVVETGDRTIVVASSRLRHRVPETLEAAERAAAVADGFAGKAGPPSRYVVYLAHAPAIDPRQPDTCDSDSDWQIWFGTKPCWSGGMFVDDTDNEVIVNGAQRDMQDTLTHELTHAASLGGNDYSGGAETWWLIEGIAEYATMLDRSASDYDMIAPTRRFISSWDGCEDVPEAIVCPPDFEAAYEDATGRYGIAFLAVRRLADLYGHDALLDFFGAVIHEDHSLDDAARSAFSQGWPDVQDDCEAFIRNA